MKAKLNIPAQEPQPPTTVTLELHIEEALELLEMLDQTGVGPGPSNKMYGPKCPVLKGNEQNYQIFGYHTYKYKRVVDALSAVLHSAGVSPTRA